MRDTCGLLWSNLNRLSNMYSQETIKTDLNKWLELKRRGELDTEEKLRNSNDEFWRDSITYDTLKSYLQNDDEQIKLNTLALVVESKKSTLKFMFKELDIIILFLQVNLKEKLEFVPLIKKALKRMKESLAVMQRQYTQEEKIRYHYQKNGNFTEVRQEVLHRSYEMSFNIKRDIEMYCNAFISLRNTCICSPDATYNRRKSSLQILLIMRDFLDNEFKHITWESEQAEALFNLMLLDTYESNKEMAFKLIKSINPTLLQLDNENVVHDIIKVAIELGNSIKPIDSVTAAYMLKLSALSPVVESVLETRFDLTESVDENTETIILQLILILLKKLKQSVVFAKENIVTTVTKYSLYGYLFCIRSLLEECDLEKVEKKQLWQNTIAELVSVCLELSCAVSVIVNNSSPEGHLPMDLSLQAISKINNSSIKQTVTPQMVLLCSWHTVKEVSLLFGLLAIKAPISEDSSSIELLNKEQIIKIGEHLVILLTETKHRGAFEQAHVGFNQLCTRLWRLDIVDLKQLPKIWLHQILIAITGIKEDNLKLCATRRSAGVPFMIQALLSTEPRQYKDTNTTTFHSVMTILLEFTNLENINLRDKARHLIYTNSVFSEYENSIESLTHTEECVRENTTQVTEIKTHALNILRTIFRNSRLGEVANNYVEDGLIAAIKSYDALTWAERNAATLLFSALIIRIFGVQRTKDHINLTTDNKMNFLLFFEKFPNLLPFILEELQTFVTTNDSLIKSNVQSILLLLSRLYHRHGSDYTNIQNKINDLVTLIIQCAKSAVFETRKLAARALVSIITEQSVGEVLMKIIENVIHTGSNNLSLNLIHGYMLQIFEIIKHFGFKQLQSYDKQWDRFLEKTSWILENLECQNSNTPCFLLATVYVNICSEIYKTDETYFIQNIRVLRVLVSHLVRQNLKQGPARELYQISVIKIIRCLGERNHLIPRNLLIEIYVRSLKIPETQIIAWSTLTKEINESQPDSMSMELLCCTVNEIRDSLKDFDRYEPELQDTIFDFLYSTLIYLDKFTSFSTKKMDICNIVLDEIRLNKKKTAYCVRDCYLRLLGKSFVIYIILNEDKDAINLAFINDVYSILCDYLWITSLGTDFRKSVFHIMRDLLPICKKSCEYRYVEIQWWTTVLQLLLDNNFEVRREAATLIDAIPIDGTLSTNTSCVNLFLSKFRKSMHSDPELICTVLFYWGVALMDDSDYEMDETDVFDKCTNYDFFEPLDISRNCVEFLMRYMKSYLNSVLPDHVTDWINSRLNTEFEKSITFRMLVRNYASYVPTLENKLHDILDPTYKNKLLQVLAYGHFKQIL